MWPWRRRKLPGNRTKESDDLYETAGPNWECRPAAPPPPNTPNPCQERDLKPSDFTHRWACAIRVARRSSALLHLAWSLLPPEIRELLINIVRW